MAANQYLQPFFDSLSQGVQVANSLRQAAQQQQQFDRDMKLREGQQALNQQQQYYNAVQSGATPVDKNGNVGSVPAQTATPTFGAPSTIDTSTGAPAAPQTATPAMPWASNGAPSPLANTGQSYQSPWDVAPSQQATYSPAPPPLTPPSLPYASVSNDGLAAGTVPGQTNGIQADPARVAQAGGQTVQVPSWADQLKRTSDQWNAQQYPAAAPDDSVAIGPELEKATGFPAGTTWSKSHMGQLAQLIGKMSPDAPNVKFSGFNAQGQPVFVNLDNKQVTLGKAVPGMAASSDADGEKPLTATARQNAADKAGKEYVDFETNESNLRSQLDRIDNAIKKGGTVTVKIDDKGKSALASVPKDDAGNPLDKDTVLADLQSERINVGNRLQQVINNKYDAGEKSGTLATGASPKWGMSREQAQADLQNRLYPKQAAAAPQTPNPQTAAPQQAAAPKLVPTDPKGKSKLKAGDSAWDKSGKQVTVAGFGPDGRVYTK